MFTVTDIDNDVEVNYYGDVMVIAYNFYLKYVYADSPTEEMKEMNDRIGSASDNI